MIPTAQVRAEIEDYRQRLITPGMTAGEFAALLPVWLRQPYWHMKLEELSASVSAEGGAQ